MGWFDLVVGEAPCTRGFLLLGGGGASSAAGPQRSVNPHGTLTCGATATKPTVSEQRPTYRRYTLKTRGHLRAKGIQLDCDGLLTRQNITGRVP